MVFIARKKCHIFSRILSYFFPINEFQLIIIDKTTKRKRENTFFFIWIRETYRMPIRKIAEKFRRWEFFSGGKQIGQNTRYFRSRKIMFDFPFSGWCVKCHFLCLFVYAFLLCIYDFVKAIKRMQNKQIFMNKYKLRIFYSQT